MAHSDGAGLVDAPQSDHPPFNALKLSLAIFVLYMVLSAVSAGALVGFAMTLHPLTRLFIFFVTVGALGYRHLRRNKRLPERRHLIWTLGLSIFYMGSMAVARHLQQGDLTAASFAANMLIQVATFMLAGLLAFGVADRIYRRATVRS